VWHCEFRDLRLQGKMSMMTAVVGSIPQTFHAECIEHIEGAPPRTSGSPPNADQANHSRAPMTQRSARAGPWSVLTSTDKARGNGSFSKIPYQAWFFSSEAVLFNPGEPTAEDAQLLRPSEGIAPSLFFVPRCRAHPAAH
jgi:hypothetical protein